MALAVRGGAAGSAPAHDGTALRHVLPQTFRLRRRKTYSTKLAPLHFYQLSLKAAPGLPEGTLGWTRDSAKRALRSLVGKIVVSGVTVFDRVQWGFAPAPEFFQCFPVPNERATEFAIRSRTEAEKWIDDFPRSDVLLSWNSVFKMTLRRGREVSEHRTMWAESRCTGRAPEVANNCA